MAVYMADARQLPPLRPQRPAPRNYALPPSSSRPLAKTAAFEAAQDARTDPSNKRRQRRLAYVALSWLVQGLCALATLLGIVWATVQILGLFNFLGISREPPGLKYTLPDLGPAPPPPPPPPSPP